MPETLKDIKQIFMDMIDERIELLKGLDLYVVTGVNEDALTLNIKRMNVNESYDNVEMMGIGLGHGKGIIKLPNVEDVVLVAFIQESRIPYVLGTVFDVFSTLKDSRVDVKLNELFATNQVNGAYWHMDQNNNILIRSPNGAKIKMDEAGGFKLFNKDNYGIECDAAGTLTIRAVAEKHYPTPGSFP